MIDAYLHEFKCLSTRVISLSQLSLLNCFLSELKDDIQQELYILKPMDLYDAVGMAKLAVEDKLNASRQAMPRPFFPHPLAPIHQLLVSRPPPLPMKHLTHAEMAARRAKGLCFNCDSQVTPGHKCKPTLFLCLMVEQDCTTTTDNRDHSGEHLHGTNTEHLSMLSWDRSFPRL